MPRRRSPATLGDAPAILSSAGAPAQAAASAHFLEAQDWLACRDRTAAWLERFLGVPRAG